MPLVARLRLRLRRDLADERGMALPTALFAMIASLALASAAVLSSVNVQQGTARDHDSKEAIAAADAGAGLALLRLNRFQDSLDPTHPCVGPAGEFQTASGGWCPSTPTESVGGGLFSYRVSAYSASGALSVVAVGVSGTVSRRVNVELFAHDGNNVFLNEKVIGQDKIDLLGTPYIRTDIGTNGDIETHGKTASICGNIRTGIGKSGPTPSCGGKKTEGNEDLPAVNPPADIATNNSNCRLSLTCLNASEVDTYSTESGKKEKEKKRTATDPWDAVKKNINLGSNAKLTLGGGDYLVCGLFVNGGGELIMAAGTHVRIFVDTPEHCGLSAGAIQVEITGNTVSTAYNPAQGTYDVPGIYVIGSPTIPTTVKLGGNTGNTNEMVLYAPYSNIEMYGTADWKGMIAGRTLTLNGSPTIESDPLIPQPDITLASLLERTRYVECTGATASPPNAYC
jgi:hypothetical protein